MEGIFLGPVITIAEFIGADVDAVQKFATDSAARLMADNDALDRLSLTFIPYILSTKDLRFDALRAPSMLLGLITPVIWRAK